MPYRTTQNADHFEFKNWKFWNSKTFEKMDFWKMYFCILGRTDGRTDRGRRRRRRRQRRRQRRDTTGHDGTDGEGINYFAKSISVVYLSKQTRTDISGLTKKAVNRCASFYTNYFVFVYTIFVMNIYIYIYIVIYIYIYMFKYCLSYIFLR